MQIISKGIHVKGESETILVLPVGDILWLGFPDEDVAIDMLARHIAWGVKHKAYFIGMGDYIDAFSPSNRARLKEVGLYDSSHRVLDRTADDLLETLYEKALAPSKGRWLGLLEGHHYHQYSDGTTSDQQLCRMLEAPFLGTSAFVRLHFTFSTSKTGRGDVKIWAHHGVGSGQRAGSPLNKLELLPAYWDADIFLMGHHHKKVATPLDRISAMYPNMDSKSPPLLIHKTVLLVGTGGFLKGYVADRKVGATPRGSYVEMKMLPPVSLGGPLIRIRPRFKHMNRAGRYNTHIWLPDLSVEL